MPRFFFHTDDGPLTFRDEVGIEMRIAEARIEATRVLGELLKDAPVEFWSSGHLIVNVESDDGSGFTLKATVGAC
jgi:hypothetical protein